MLKLKYDVIIIGMGPSGIFCAYEIMKNNPNKSVLIIDQGKPIEQRYCTAEKIGPCLKCKPICNTTCGFAGSEAFLDGKLHLYNKSKFNQEEHGINIGENENTSIFKNCFTKRQLNNLLEYTDNIFLSYGADEKINGLDNPDEINLLIERSKEEEVNLVDIPVRHIGTEKLRKIFNNLQNELIASNNITLLFETKVEDLIIAKDLILGVICKKNNLNSDSEIEEIFAEKIILAVGKNGASWLSEISKKHNIEMKKNEVEIGVRYELPNSTMNKINNLLYEANFSCTPAPYYDNVRIDSQNPCGFVSTEIQNNIAVSCGHSYKNKKSKNTNLAILVTHKFCEPFNQSFEYIENIAKNMNLLANGNIIIQRLGDIYNGKRTWKFELDKNSVHPTSEAAVPGDITLSLGYRTTTNILKFIEKMEKIIPGFANKENLLYGPEIRLHKNKIKLDKNFETSIKNLHCIGEGGGLTSGLMLTCASGIYMARLIKKFDLIKEEQAKKQFES